MKHILIILSLFLFGSCVTQQNCQRKFPPIEKTKDSIIIREVKVPVYIYDTTFIKPDTVYDTTTIYKKNGLYESRTVTVETLLCKASSKVLHGRLRLNLTQRDTLLIKIINDSIKANVKDTYHEKTIVKTKVIYKVHWYDKAARSIAGGLLIILFIFGIIKFMPKPF